MSRGQASALRSALRFTVLATVVAAPWAFGAVHPQVYSVLLVVAYVGGIASWARGHWGRAHGETVPRVPGSVVLATLLAIGLVQLLPLPEGVLRVVSPGSHALASFVSLTPQLGWRPISVSPPDTLRAVVFVGGMSLLYGFSFREFRSRTWRHRAAGAVVLSAALMSVEALVQAGSSPKAIYGFFHPRWDWAVFGPFVNKNQFGGYVALAFPLALAWSRAAQSVLARAWRRRGYLALGDRAGTDWLLRAALVAVLAFSLIACRSRGALVATVLAAVVGPLAVRRLGHALVAAGVLAACLLFLVGTETFTQQVAQGTRDSRLAFWTNSLEIARDFPVFGSGLNTFGIAFMRYQKVFRNEWLNAAHNDYLQALTDGGFLWAAGVVALTVLLLRRALEAARSGGLAVGLLGSVIASCAHALVDFNWQIPGIAATFCMLAGLAAQGGAGRLDPSDSDP